MLQILVPTDFSNNSYNALHYAARLFKEKECTFHIVNVCSNENDADREKAKVASLESLEALVHRLVRDVGANNDHTFTKVSLCSDMTKGVAGYAKEHKVDLTVIGNKAKEEIKHILFGNNAMQLVRELTSCPVLIVPLEIDFKRVDKIAFTSNYANPIAAENIRALRFFGDLMGSVIVPMGIEEENVAEVNRRNKADFLASMEKKASKEVKLPIFDGKANTILEFVDLWSIDMLCMVYYPHHFFLEFIGKGIIKELNTKLKVPFLILPNTPN
ncbi:universal stress protein [Flagellimonas oceanensis]|uniref:universal stress protein n=1 Tax=Flagellimonas oceanensis TaxID=2499163 RepID=UPI000F8EE9A4|nr:universal stress protein [Allomuricauda oceanensis]|tara:strand:- start:10309 stop:11124 length:816 start_codon:yes stop_codon:yes gene_type:complete